MTNGEAVKALRAEFPEVPGSKIKRTFEKSRRAGAGVSEAYERIREAGRSGAFGPGTVRISAKNPTFHEAQLHADGAISGSSQLRV